MQDNAHLGLTVLLARIASGIAPYDRSTWLLIAPVRLGFLLRGKMLGYLSLCVALAFSAIYEMIEWWVALLRDKVRRISSAPRATRGIRNRTCSWRCSARRFRSPVWRVFRTDR